MTYILPVGIHIYFNLLRSLLQQGLSEPEFYGQLVYFRKIVGKTEFSDQFKNYDAIQTYR